MKIAIELPDEITHPLGRAPRTFRFMPVTADFESDNAGGAIAANANDGLTGIKLCDDGEVPDPELLEHPPSPSRAVSLSTPAPASTLAPF